MEHGERRTFERGETLEEAGEPAQWVAYVERGCFKYMVHNGEEGELDKDVVVSKMEIDTQHGTIEGKTQMSEAAFYSLDAIIAVGYRCAAA